MTKYYKIVFWNKHSDSETSFYGYKSEPDAWEAFPDKEDTVRLLYGKEYSDGYVYPMDKVECDRLGYGRFR